MAGSDEEGRHAQRNQPGRVPAERGGGGVHGVAVERPVPEQRGDDGLRHHDEDGGDGGERGEDRLQAAADQPAQLGAVVTCRADGRVQRHEEARHDHRLGQVDDVPAVGERSDRAVGHGGGDGAVDELVDVGDGAREQQWGQHPGDLAEAGVAQVQAGRDPQPEAPERQELQHEPGQRTDDEADGQRQHAEPGSEARGRDDHDDVERDALGARPAEAPVRVAHAGEDVGARDQHGRDQHHARQQDGELGLLGPEARGQHADDRGGEDRHHQPGNPQHDHRDRHRHVDRPVPGAGTRGRAALRLARDDRGDGAGHRARDEAEHDVHDALGHEVGVKAGARAEDGADHDVAEEPKDGRPDRQHRHEHRSPPDAPPPSGCLAQRNPSAGGVRMAKGVRLSFCPSGLVRMMRSSVAMLGALAERARMVPP